MTATAIQIPTPPAATKTVLLVRWLGKGKDEITEIRGIDLATHEPRTQEQIAWSGYSPWYYVAYDANGTALAIYADIYADRGWDRCEGIACPTVVESVWFWGNPTNANHAEFKKLAAGGSVAW